MAAPLQIPSPALVVLVGPAASGKSTWAGEHFQPDQIVSSDALRGVVGEGAHDLRASTDAFAVLDEIVARRLRRHLTTVVDTLGLDATQRARWMQAGRAAGVACVAVVFDTPSAECRRRNAERSLPVPADVVANQLRRWPDTRNAVRSEGWDAVHEPQPAVVVPATLVSRRRTAGATALAVDAPQPIVRVGLHLSSFDWPGGREQLATQLRSIATAAEACGVDHVWMMDHLRQIPQVGPAWADLPSRTPLWRGWLR